MKKILTHLTGIVILITVLAAGGCSPADNNGQSKDSKTVKIYLKATNGKSRDAPRGVLIISVRNCAMTLKNESIRKILMKIFFSLFQ